VSIRRREVASLDETVTEVATVAEGWLMVSAVNSRYTWCRDRAQVLESARSAVSEIVLCGGWPGSVSLTRWDVEGGPRAAKSRTGQVGGRLRPMLDFARPWG
jgi:hypothetical protein